MVRKQLSNLGLRSGRSGVPVEPAADLREGLGLGARLRARRSELGLTLEQAAERAGCAKSYLSMLETGAKALPPSSELIGRLEGALGVRRGEFAGLAAWESTPATVRRQVEALESTRRSALQSLHELIGRGPPRRQEDGGQTRADASGPRSPSAVLDELWRAGKLQELVQRLGGASAAGEDRASAAGGSRGFAEPLAAAMPVEVPLINSVQAGYPRDFTDLGYPARVADSSIRSPDIRDPDAFACRVVGDSMMPDYREGDIVIFSPARAVTDGCDCFVRLEPDHQTTFKRVYFERGAGGAHRPGSAASAKKEALWRELSGEGEPSRPPIEPGKHTHIRLQPLNDKYPAQVLEREQVAGLYAAVSVTRKVGG